MLLNLMKSKIHCATVTEANLAYMGSITIDEALMEAAHILPHERVQVVNNNNGARLETYVIKGARGSGVVCLNGAAARCVQPGDIVIIHDTGAHGSAMGFNYNGKLHCAELLRRMDGSIELIRRAQTLDDYFATRKDDGGLMK